jgi:hypothetical protein
MNEITPQRFAGKPVYVCLLSETSDGRKIHFARIRFVLASVYDGSQLIVVVAKDSVAVKAWSSLRI